MDSDGLLGKIFSVQTFLAIIAALNFVGWFRAHNERRRDESAARGEDWKRVVAERDRYHDLLIKCQVERGEWMRRAITAEATLQGYGEVRQIRAISEATKRLSGPEGGGK